MIWGDYDNIKVDMGDDHDRTTQRVYHYRRLSAILEPLDWLFTDIKDVEYSANRWFEVDGQDMFEFNDKNKDTYIALGWGKWWKNPGIVDESADFLDGSSTNTSFAEFRDAEDEALMQGDLTMEELMAEEAYAEELYENGMEAYVPLPGNSPST